MISSQEVAKKGETFEKDGNVFYNFSYIESHSWYLYISLYVSFVSTFQNHINRNTRFMKAGTLFCILLCFRSHPEARKINRSPVNEYKNYQAMDNINIYDCQKYNEDLGPQPYIIHVCFVFETWLIYFLAYKNPVHHLQNSDKSKWIFQQFFLAQKLVFPQL